MPDTVMIVAGETSGELYGALLARELERMRPGVRLVGVGGERMKEAGVELLAWITSAFGLSEAIASIRRIRETFRKASEALRTHKPSVVVLIDYPDFNLKLAAEARRRGVKVLYYVSPQVWAWRRGRVRKIAGLVDRMAVILPFEEKIYQEAGLAAEFVGHPVCDEIRTMEKDKGRLRSELGLEPERPLVALLPGSRPHELDRLLPLMLEVVKEMRQRDEGLRFALPFAPNTDLHRYQALIEEMERQGVSVTKGTSLRTLAASDAAVIASGTATLQAALIGIPLVVVYKLSPLSFWLGKRIVKVRHISLVNILSGGEVVRELIQGEATAEAVCREIAGIMGEGGRRDSMLRAYDGVQAAFSGRNASRRVAEMVCEMASWGDRAETMNLA